MIRFLYRCLIWSHPPSFRRNFGAEMLWIFDAEAAHGPWCLVRDGCLSLLRQWVLRSGLWKVPLAACGGLLAPILGLWMLPLLHTGVVGIRVDDDSLGGLMVLIAVSSMLVIGMTVTLCVFWLRFFRRRGA